MMEDLLMDIAKEANTPKFMHIRKACQDARDLLCLQQGTIRDPSFELRKACFLPLQLALETKKTKLVNLSLNGFHKILRDDRFHKGIEPENDSLWLPSQLLCATASLMYHTSENQVHIMRVLLAMSLSSRRTLNGRLVLWVVSRCGEAAAGGVGPVSNNSGNGNGNSRVSAQVVAAAAAAAAQTVRAFCMQLDEECQELLTEGSPLGQSKAAAVGCFSEVIPVIQYLCSRLSETQMSSRSNSSALFFLECLLALMSSLPEIVNCNTHFTTFLWQKFCPSLIAFLGTPRVDKNIKSRDHEGNNVDDSGRGSGSLSGTPSFNSQQAKTVYSIAAELVRLVGCVPSLRPVLEALYHRMLLYPPVAHRSEALSSVKEMLRDSSKLRQLFVLKTGSNVVDHHSDDMAIIRLIMDAIEECGSYTGGGSVASQKAAVECIHGVVQSLKDLCINGVNGSDNASIAARQVSNRWHRLQDADYQGPLTYQSLARLPLPYRDVIAELQCSKESKSPDSSDTSGPEESGVSDAEQDSDADSVFLPSRDSHNAKSDDIAANDPSKRNSSDSADFDNSLPKSLNLGRCNITEYNVDLERHNAKQFVGTLKNVLVPKLLNLRTGVEVDEAMQDFASKCCQYNATQSLSTATIMNADGIYLATYSALLLNLKLIHAGHYGSFEKIQIPLTEDQFVEEVHGSGVLVYLSATWLRELYQQILSSSLLEAGGFVYVKESGNIALINLLIDMGGLGSNQIMSDWQRLMDVSSPNGNTAESPAVAAGMRLARRMLTCIWDSMVSVLSEPLLVKMSSKSMRAGERLSNLIAQRTRTTLKRKRVKEGIITLCLESLHEAARLSNILGLQSRCSSLLALLADSACSEEPNGKILSTHALSLDVLISGGLELGSKAPECWDHIFMACQYVLRLEHSLFGLQCNATTSLITMQSSRSKTISSIHSGTMVRERLNCSFNPVPNREDESCIDVYDFLQIDNPTLQQDTSVISIIQKCQHEANRTNSVGVLQGTDAAKVCCALLQSVETLFNDAANKLTMPALCSFLDHLFKYCYKQLFTICMVNPDGNGQGLKWWPGPGQGVERSQCDAALRLWWRGGEAALRALRSARPLAHRMSIWGVVGPHFMQVACHKDRCISSKAIQCIHDAVTVLLNEQVELPHFHFNEALLKPFENLLCLELCDNDVQEQIISCICEFVEANRTEIRSGWRPLFGTLRGANNSSQHVAILDIFKVFLTTDNTLVFANAAHDCIMCLLSHIKGAANDTPINIEPSAIKNQESSSNNNYAFNIKQRFKRRDKYIIPPAHEESSNIIDVDMCLESLKYLENCAQILSVMYTMPRCPVFNTAYRINSDMPVSVVDPIIPSASLELTKFSDDPCENEECVVSYKTLSTALPSSQTANYCLSKLDRPSGVLKVWYSMIEGLVSATIVCPKKYQSKTLEVLYKILRDVLSVPGPAFGLHCINHLLLPMVQNWLRQIFKTSSCWDSFTPNFKQCCGMTTDLIVDYLHHLQGENIGEYKENNENVKWCHNSKISNIKELPPVENKNMTFAIKQILLIQVECIAQPNESIARLGASCIRHLILTSGHILTDQQWKIVCTSLHRACNVSLTPLKQLTLAFKSNSNSFFGDLAMVKVAARRDCTVNDNIRFHSMAQQVFLFDYMKELSMKPKESNYMSSRNHMSDPALTDDRSYIFLLYPQDVVSTLNPDLYTVRVPHKCLVVGLLAHQILLQIIATILLQSSSNIIPNIDQILIDNCKSNGLASNQKYSISAINQDLLLKCLDMSYKRAINFDLRPGLKFLVQKVSNLDCASNLYKQTTSAWIIKMMSLLEFFLTGTSTYNLNVSDVAYILKSCNVSEVNDIKDYDQFIRNIIDLKRSWELMCKIYIEATIFRKRNHSFSQLQNESESNLDVNSKSADGDYEGEVLNSVGNSRPFTFADFRRHSVESDADSGSCEDMGDAKEHKIVYSSNENIAQEDKEDFDDNKENVSQPNLNSIKERYVADSSIDLSEKLSKNFSHMNTKVNPFRVENNEPILPPQPVPPEIEQQRAQSITKDAEIRRLSLANVITACLELVLSFPDEQFELVDPVLEEGYNALSKNTTDQMLLQRLETYATRKDTV